MKARRIVKIDAEKRGEETKDPPSATTLHHVFVELVFTVLFKIYVATTTVFCSFLFYYCSFSS